MASTINALTGSGGVAILGDTSGEIALQNNGTTIATVSSAGIAMASGKTLTGDALSNGKILQVVQQVLTTKVATTSASFVDTGVTLAITPSATSSKILIEFAGMFGTGGGYDSFYQILRGSTVLEVPQKTRLSDTSSNQSYVTVLLDSPSTTSATTYKVQFKVSANEVFLNRDASNNQCGFTTITLYEVAA